MNPTLNSRVFFVSTFEIFKAGKQTSSAGQSISFSEDDLSATIAAYDPALHEAPITIGHPKDNLPAYGWISKISNANGTMSAEAIQVDPEFSEMVKAGRFKKRSASFYAPDSPNNPVKGVYYLRHVAFLGAEPPAVKGLKDVNFSEEETGIVEFSDSFLVAGIFSRLREFLLDKFTPEDADRVVPKYLIESLEEEARREVEQPVSVPNFSENQEDQSMTLEELQAENERLKAQVGELEQKTTDFSEREESLKARELELEKAEVEKKIQSFCESGQLLPAQKDQAFEIALSMSNEKNIDFAEGEKISQRDQYFAFLGSLPKSVDFAEHTEEAETIEQLKDSEIADRAQKMVSDAKANGRSLSFSEAVGKVRSELNLKD